jgi:hypothetical protein
LLLFFPFSTVVYGSQGPNFPVRWDPRYTIAAGFAANPDHREEYTTNSTGPREPAVELVEDSGDYYVNPADQPQGFVVNGTLPVSNDQGVHSLTVRLSDAKPSYASDTFN